VSEAAPSARIAAGHLVDVQVRLAEPVAELPSLGRVDVQPVQFAGANHPAADTSLFAAGSPDLGRPRRNRHGEKNG
jgi:hypothetical protein